MSGDNRVTTDHEEIRLWAESRGGDAPGILRIDFPDHGDGGSLESISRDEFFDKFEEIHLAFIYQDETAGGDTSRFFKLVDRSHL